MSSSEEGKLVAILVVEDEMLVRMFLADILQDAGYHVIEARDGLEAIAMLELRQDVTVLLTDIGLPNLDGLTLAKIVSERWPHVGIVVASGAVPVGLELNLPTGALFIRKPYSTQVVLQSIAAVLPGASAPVALSSVPTLQPGKPHGAGGLAQPLPEPED